MKRRLCNIAIPAVSDIPERMKFVSHLRHLKACTELISVIWCIIIKKAKAILEATNQRGTGSAILPLNRRHRYDRVYSSNIINARFETDTLFSDIKSLNQNVCAQVINHKVGFTATYPMQAGSGDTIGKS